MKIIFIVAQFTCAKNTQTKFHKKKHNIFWGVGNQKKINC